MANKELLLVILVTVIVAISIAVAFQTINSGEVSPNRAAILQGINNAIGLSNAYYDRPSMYGGGEHSFKDITLNELNLDSVTLHGTYELTDITHTSFKLIGRPKNNDQILTVVIYRDSIAWE